MTYVITMRLKKFHNLTYMHDQVQLQTYHPIPVKDIGENGTIYDKFCFYVIVENGLSM